MTRLFLLTATVIVILFNQCIELNAFLNQPTTITTGGTRRSTKQTSLLKPLQVSEFHIPGYREGKRKFLLTEEDIIEHSGGGGGSVLTKLEEQTYDPDDCTTMIPYQSGHLLHKTNIQVFSKSECDAIIEEAEQIASQNGWTTGRHGNYPTTDIPVTDLPNTMKFFRKALVQRIYPLLRMQFCDFLPKLDCLRVVDGFVVKYDAEGGQAELKPHRDGSVLSFNIALNSEDEFEGGGTWFASLDDTIKINQGEMVSHASSILHGGHAITKGKRYILVAFVIVEDFHAWSMRFYNQVRNL